MADPGNLQVPPLGGIQSGVVTGGVSPALVLGIVNGIAILGVSAVVYRQVMDLQSQVAAYKADIVHLNNQLGNLAREVQGLNNKVATYDKILKKIPKMRGEFFEITEGDRREWQEGLRRSLTWQTFPSNRSRECKSMGIVPVKIRGVMRGDLLPVAGRGTTMTILTTRGNYQSLMSKTISVISAETLGVASKRTTK